MSNRPHRPQIPTETVCRIVVKARQFDVKEDVVEGNPGSNAADDQFRGVLASYADDPVYEELKTFIDGLDVDDQYDLVALVWLGRGDFKAQEWRRALALARQEHTEHTTAYLLGTPLLPDYLEEGLALFGLNCLGFEKDRL